MSIKLTDIKNIVDIIKMRFGKNLYKMDFIFSCKTGPGKYFIFQEVKGMPIKRLIYEDSNNSLSFVASWSAWGNPYALVVDANDEKVEGWQDVLDRSRPYNAYSFSASGPVYGSHWQSPSRRNKKEKTRQHKTESDTFFEFRVDKIERACFYGWGFELFSPTISLIALIRRRFFPYQVEGVNHNDEAYDQDYRPADGIFIIEWNGKSFNVKIPSGISTVMHPPGGGGEAINIFEPDSYWDKNECDEANELFDEEIADLLLNNERTKEEIFDVGQRDIDLIIE